MNSSALEGERSHQGKVSGIIVPPPEIRVIVDKTAQYVAKNGKSFEQRIMNSEEGKSQKFSFLRPFDPYHAYYEHRIYVLENPEVEVDIEVEEEGGNGPMEVVVEQEQDDANSSGSGGGVEQVVVAKASTLSPIAQLARNKVIEKPPDYSFISACPPGTSAMQIEIIKLTAQFASIKGKNFLDSVVEREDNNRLYDFLHPTHYLFNYFSSLVDSYVKCMHTPQQITTSIATKSTRFGALECAVGRWKWQRGEEEKRRVVADEDLARAADAMIDWYDFVVVETIDFDDAPSKPLNSSTTAASISTSNGNSSSCNRVGITASVESCHGGGGGDEDGDDDNVDDDGATIMVLTDYDSSNFTDSTHAKNKTLSMVDPVSGRAIPMQELSEHMRVQLLDPKWREQKKRFEDKHKSTGLAAGAAIADSLKEFARRRGDGISGVSEIVKPAMPPSVEPATKKSR